MVGSLAINSKDHIFAGTYEGGVFLSTNNGDNWTQINNGLPIDPFTSDIYILSLAVNSSDHIFASVEDGGVFQFTDIGENWVAVNNGLPFKNPLSLGINSSGYIFAGTSGGGVFRSINPTVSVEEKNNFTPLEFSLAQNYPNPFNPSTKIKYAIPGNVETRHGVSLRVYDVLGNEVATLVNEEKEAGSYEVEWNAVDKSSGVYFYQLKAGEYANTKKMILLR
ncbi:MAG TPA: hypothetical protein DCE80_01095 [Ignavibacteriales bacterium]|nr:hypothetical protein [Ignavibacteriales bacterium]